MKVFRGLPNAVSRAPCALTIGNFDGVHLGHQALLARVSEAAGKLGLVSAVMTFEPHPREYFAGIQGDPAKAPARIANLRDKLRSLHQAGKAATTAPNKEVLLRLIRDGRKKGLLKDTGHEQVDHFVRQFLTIVVTNASSSNSSTVQIAGPK